MAEWQKLAQPVDVSATNVEKTERRAAINVVEYGANARAAMLYLRREKRSPNAYSGTVLAAQRLDLRPCAIAVLGNGKGLGVDHDRFGIEGAIASTLDSRPQGAVNGKTLLRPAGKTIISLGRCPAKSPF